MNKLVKYILLYALTLFWIFVLLTISRDVESYNSIMSNGYETPWYDNSWIKQPYTSLRLMNSPYKDYWTKNVVGDDWYVRDVKHHGKEFWTILKRGAENE